MTNSIAIVNDTHFGARNDKEVFLNNQIEFFRVFFIPEIQKRGIKKIVWAGDVFDKRKNINIRTLSRVRKEIFDKLKAAGIQIIMLAGNHDVYYKNTNEYNSIRELLGDYSNIEIIDTLPEVRGEFGGLHKVGYVPWICQANYDDCMGMLDTTEARVVIGHFEIAGFDMHPGIPCHHGMQSKTFERFQKVLSGHFHTRSTVGNITYLGTQYQMTWADYGDPKGFNILHEDLELEFVQHDNPMFIRFVYAPKDDSIYWPVPKKVKDKYVKIIVKERDDETDSAIMVIRSGDPADLKIVENAHNYTVEENLDVEVEDTATLMNKYVDTLELDVDPIRVKTILQELHTESLRVM